MYSTSCGTIEVSQVRATDGGQCGRVHRISDPEDMRRRVLYRMDDEGDEAATPRPGKSVSVIDPDDAVGERCQRDGTAIMTFLWPEMLWLLLAAPLLVAFYFWLLRRRKKNAIRYASVSLMKVALGPAHRLRRHLPPLLFLLAVIASIIAIARPSAVITLPSQQQTIMLAMDVSLSMGAKDVDPNRLTAAQLAAKSFVEEYPADTRIGIVAFGATASLVQSPTQNREDLLAAIDRFQLQRGTATGSALYVALATLFPDAGIDLESLVFKGGLTSLSAPPGPRQEPKPAAEKKEFKPVPPGSYTSAVIILLSDGRRTTGPDPLEAAKMARRSRREGLYGRLRNQGGGVHRLRRLVRLRSPGRGDAEGDRGNHARRILPCGHGDRSQEGVPKPQRATRAWSARKRKSRSCSRPSPPVCCSRRRSSRCSGSTGRSDAVRDERTPAISSPAFASVRLHRCSRCN